jgi:hypothetical protein
MSRPHTGARRRLNWYLTRTRLISLLVLAALAVASFGSLTIAQPSNCTNLVADSSFESGAGWQSTTSGDYALLGNFQARTGVQAAHLAGIDNANDQLTLPLTLPADKPRVTLTFWWQIQSEEESGEFDGLSVLVADAGGNILRSLLTLGSSSAANQWQQSTVDLSGYTGQSIQLKFAAQTDNTLVTDFFVDDVTVEACGAAAADFNVFLPLTQR